MVRFLISSDAAKLAGALASYGRTATVEAEYGDAVVEGSVLTLAHHGPRSGNPAPCLAKNGVTENIEAVGLSHIDLDSLGGCAAIIGRKPDASGFWQLSAFVDVNGPHKLSQSSASPEDIRRLNAYWAWSESRKVFPPRDGSSLDVTDKVMEGIEAIERIVADDEGLLTAGEEFAAKAAELNRTSFREEVGGVIVRVAEGFSNHLYLNPASGEPARAVVALRRDFSAVTVSLADPIPGVSCKDIVQGLWGPKAGGHAGIAGGPRDAKMGEEDLLRARDATVAALAGK